MGRLVDDAVVVLESIHRQQRQGLNPYRAALEGTNAVAVPVLASTLTTMAVLLPVLLLAGLAKKLANSGNGCAPMSKPARCDHAVPLAPRRDDSVGFVRAVLRDFVSHHSVPEYSLRREANRPPGEHDPAGPLRAARETQEHASPLLPATAEQTRRGAVQFRYGRHSNPGASSKYYVNRRSC